jgi:hypothetical protein
VRPDNQPPRRNGGRDLRDGRQKCLKNLALVLVDLALEFQVALAVVGTAGDLRLAAFRLVVIDEAEIGVDERECAVPLAQPGRG